MNWTEEQTQAIYENGSNILVAAAAGSGKTAVLVERIINKIINYRIDIDKILVVTFTNLAAGQMRERILDAIYKKIEENPEDMHLQRQISLLPKANICTIDSFCLDVVKNNFFELEISPNFRIADEIELKIMKQETIEELFEDKYESKDEKFMELINTYTTYRGDENLKTIILKIYNFIQSNPYPDKWLESQVERFNIKDDIDFSETAWGRILFENAKDDILDGILQLKELRDISMKDNDLPKTYVTLAEDVRKLEKLDQSYNWNELYTNFQEFFFDRWPKDKNASLEMTQKLKQKRDIVKKNIDSIKKNIVIYDSKDALKDAKDLYDIMKKIAELVFKYEKIFKAKKNEKNLVDFSDIEHFALDILRKNDVPTEIAKKYQEKFCEIAIDEYQDSNMVQEYILTTVSKNNNIFMVGDVKQSIYKFRQARPELFLEKYNSYKLKEEKNENDNLKIKLFKNFRSRKEVLNLTNQIFQNIMSEEFGEIEYNEEEYLNLGADYIENTKMIPELHIIEMEEKEDTEDQNEEEKLEEDIPIEGVVLEAKFVAKQIRKMLDEEFLVSDKNKDMRKCTYKDFAILLRSTKNSANIFEKELEKLNIPVFCDATAEYLESYEIQIIMNLLRVIDNPAIDIPQITVMRSIIGNFNDNELLEIRMNNKDKAFYYSMKEYLEKDSADYSIKNKINDYLQMINDWRNKSKYLPLDELIWSIYMETGFYNYVSLLNNGEYRIANLKMLFEKAKQYEKTSFKGLYNFINFIDKLQISSGDMSGAKIIGENENVVRIMSIHKSKGLEFPIVFLSSIGKRFNVMDLNNDDILLHNELGLGPKYIDADLNIKFDTLVKKAISLKTKQELVAEELRILYVALTRAKEKMIITGIEKDFDKKMNEKKELLECYERYNTNKISKNILKKYMRYLDFFELMILYNADINNIITINKHIFKDVLNNHETEIIDSNLKIKESNNESINKVNEILNWNYEFLASTQIISKSSVSKIKTMQNEDTVNDELKFNEPLFVKDKIEINNARKGTLTHLILQNLNLNINYEYSDVKKLIDTFVDKKIITEKEGQAIKINKILAFTKSKIYMEMRNAKKVCREQPFYINIPSSMIYDEKTDDKILVQGIIDLYYVKENDEMVLVDYKTDYVENEKDLVNKYIKQLELYKLALENLAHKEVSEIYIYSTYLEKEIKL